MVEMMRSNEDVTDQTRLLQQMEVD